MVMVPKIVIYGLK